MCFVLSTVLSRLYQARVRQSALQCFLAVVKCVEKRILYGYWSSFVPDAPGIGGPPPLTLLTIALKDPSPKVKKQVRCCPFSFWHERNMAYLTFDVQHLLLGAGRLSAGSVCSSRRFSPVPLQRWRHQCTPPGLHSLFGHISCQCKRAAPLLAASTRSRVLLSDTHSGPKGNRTHTHTSVLFIYYN